LLLKKLVSYAKLVPISDFDCEATFIGIASSSKLVKNGDVFFAIEGLNDDGNKYVAEAVKNGACAVVTQQKYGHCLKNIGVPVFGSADVRASLSYAFDMINGYPSCGMKYIAVTGTNGKTTISHMLYRIMCMCGRSCGLIGTCGAYFNGERICMDAVGGWSGMTTPNPNELYKLLSVMKQKGAQYVILEASSHASVLGRLAPLRFCTSVFSNLSPEHLDFHGNMENYFAAKCEIIKRSDVAVVNCDDPYGKRILSEADCKRIISSSTFDSECSFYASDVKMHGCDGISFVLRGETKPIECYLPIIGDFNVSNAMLAASAARCLDVPRTCISAALSKFSGVEGRLQRIYGEDVRARVFIDYAHTPDALKRLLITARAVNSEGGRIILLFGCGGDRDRSKRPRMGEIAVELADMALITSDNSRSEDALSIISDILDGIPKEKSNYAVIPDRREAIRYAVSIAKPTDIVLLAGKGHEKYEINKNGKLPFDEEYEVLRASELCKSDQGSTR
jgi:UDP-N-acetylmuramoyl-L-alanyl-D-glutamate--2,6-diaminopimelate ligase